VEDEDVHEVGKKRAHVIDVHKRMNLKTHTSSEVQNIDVELHAECLWHFETSTLTDLSYSMWWHLKTTNDYRGRER
jgi:hypothetical protein